MMIHTFPLNNHSYNNNICSAISDMYVNKSILTLERFAPQMLLTKIFLAKQTEAKNNLNCRLVLNIIIINTSKKLYKLNAFF